jgi:hypothetical protein
MLLHRGSDVRATPPEPPVPTASGATAVVHVLYRYTESVGRKPRPDYFSKELALRSFVQALQPVRDDVTVTFLVDGRVSAEVGALMDAAGEVRRGHWNSNRASYAAQLRLATGLQADVIWFAEDDYLYAPHALRALVTAVRELPRVSWFALSGPTPLERLELRRAQSAVPLPRSKRWREGARAIDGSAQWRRIDSTTSTFGGRPHAIRRDRWLLRLCPWSGAAWDRTTCLALQGATPYPWRYLFSDLLPPSTPRRRRSARVAWRIVTRIAVNLAARTRRPHREVLVAPTVPLVGHMDLPYENDPERWHALAAGVATRSKSRDSNRLLAPLRAR